MRQNTFPDGFENLIPKCPTQNANLKKDLGENSFLRPRNWKNDFYHTLKRTPFTKEWHNVRWFFSNAFSALFLIIWPNLSDFSGNKKKRQILAKKFRFYLTNCVFLKTYWEWGHNRSKFKEILWPINVNLIYNRTRFIKSVGILPNDFWKLK